MEFWADTCATIVGTIVASALTAAFGWTIVTWRRFMSYGDRIDEHDHQIAALRRERAGDEHDA